jgi:hypothetical protein
MLTLSVGFMGLRGLIGLSNENINTISLGVEYIVSKHQQNTHILWKC